MNNFFFKIENKIKLTDILNTLDVRSPGPRFGDTSWEPGDYSGDGSGGMHTKDARPRRCGWAVVRVRDAVG